jgi:hypothetical protein
LLLEDRSCAAPRGYWTELGRRLATSTVIPVTLVFLHDNSEAHNPWAEMAGVFFGEQRLLCQARRRGRGYFWAQVLGERLSKDCQAGSPPNQHRSSMATCGVGTPYPTRRVGRRSSTGAHYGWAELSWA